MKLQRFLIGLLLAGSAFAGDDAPGWLRDLSTLKTSSAYPSKTSAVVLLDEMNLTIEENGKVVTTERRAVKILTREGRKEARGEVIYLKGSGNVREMHAWVIRPSGDVKKFGKERILDVTAAPNDVYNEVRAREVTGEDDTDPGAIFAYEAVSEQQSVFSQFEYNFQEFLPVITARLTMTLPSGWLPKAVTFNGDVPMQTSGSTFTWECHDLKAIEHEPASPSVTALALRIAASYVPADGAKATMAKVFTDWSDVSRWLAELEDPQSAPNSEISNKVQALTAGTVTDLDRVRSIGHYVQGVKYVAIQTGIGRGGGYVPHSAAQVFEKQYGDCKDKANLMRTMLKVAGIPSYMVSIYSSDPTYVRENWPSPQQFNHAIIAVKVSAAAVSPAIVEVPKLGRLLFFDPTDEYTPLGDLPQREQGSFALVDDTAAGQLVRMPAIPSMANRVERETEVTLAPDGSIVSKTREQAFGQSASGMRYRLREHGNGEFEKWIEQWVSGGANGATVAKVEPADAFAEDRFDLGFEFAAPRYAQLMRGRLLLFRPAVLPRRGTLLFADDKRENPIVLHAQAFEETVHAKLPAGFKIDEMPDGGKLETQFGSYTASYTSKDGELLFKRKLEIRSATFPADQYAALKTFFEQVAGSEQSPVVLVKE